MKTVSFYQYGDGSELNDKVVEWIKENENKIVEIIDIEFQQYDNVFVATIRYIE